MNVLNTIFSKKDVNKDLVNFYNNQLNKYLRLFIQRKHPYEYLLKDSVDITLPKNKCILCTNSPCKFNFVNWRLCKTHIPNTDFFIDFCNITDDKIVDINVYFENKKILNENAQNAFVIKMYKDTFGKKVVTKKQQNEFFEKLEQQIKENDFNTLEKKVLESIYTKYIGVSFMDYAYLFSKNVEKFKELVNNNIKTNDMVIPNVIQQDVIQADSCIDDLCTKDLISYPCYNNECLRVLKIYKSEENKKNIHLLLDENTTNYYLTWEGIKPDEKFNLGPKVIETNNKYTIYDANELYEKKYIQFEIIKDNIHPHVECFYNIFKSNSIDSNKLIELGLSEDQSIFWSEPFFKLKVMLFSVFHYDIIRLVLQKLKPIHDKGYFHCNLNEYNTWISGDNYTFIFHSKLYKKNNNWSEFKSHQFYNQLFHGNSIDILKKSHYKSRVKSYFDILDSIDFLSSTQTDIINKILRCITE